MGAAAAALVTSWLHYSPFWGQRLGSSRFRRANLPVGGSIAIAAGLIAPTGGSVLLAAGIAEAIVAIAWAWVDPLPPVGVL